MSVLSATDRIAARAATVRLLPMLLSALAAPFTLLGWLVFWVGVSARSGGLRCATVLRWVLGAFLVGYDMARERRAG